MADRKQITVNPVLRMANPQRVLPDCTSAIISLGSAPICRHWHPVSLP
jgi:hypothetical protein